MADVTITVTILEVFKIVARRTALVTETDPFYASMSVEKKQLSQLHGESDRLTSDLLDEAAREVLKNYLSRQGDASGVPFEKSSTSIIYRFAEATPVITQAAAVKSRLQNNTRDAIAYCMMASLYKIDGNQNKLIEMQAKYDELINELSGDLYRLHD